MPVLDRRIVYRVINQTAPGLNSVRRDVSRTQKQAVGLGGAAKVAGVALGGLAAVGVTGLTKLVGAQLRSSDEMQKLGLRIGVGTETLSRWKFAAEQSGTSLDKIVTGQQRFSRVLLDAEQGLKSATDTLDALGLTYDKLRAQSPEEQFASLAQAIAEVDDPSRRLALAQEALGRSGAELIPLLAGGADGLAALGAQAEATGNILDQDAADAAARTNDAMNRLTTKVKGLGLSLFADLLPAVEGTVAGLEFLVTGAGEIPGVLERVIGTANRAEEAIRSLGLAHREASGFTLDMKEAQAIAERQIEETRTAMEGYIGVATEAVYETGNLGASFSMAKPAATELEMELERLAKATGSVSLEHPAVIEGLYTEAAAHRAAKGAAEEQTAALAALQFQMSSLDVAGGFGANALLAHDANIQRDLQRVADAPGLPGELDRIGPYDPGRLKELGLEWNAKTREWLEPAITRGGGGTGGGGGGGRRVLEDQLSEEEQARKTLEDQLLQMYADARIGEDTYLALLDSTDLQATLNDLVGSVSEEELRALETVRSAAWRSGQITAEGSRSIVSAIRGLSALAAGRGVGGGGGGGSQPTELRISGNLRESLSRGGPNARVFTRGDRVVAVSSSRLVGGLSESQRDIVDFNRARREGRLTPEGNVIPAMASGGIVRASPGGTIVRVGEGGRDEAIIPLRQGGSSLTVNVVVDGRTLATGAVSEVQRAFDRGEITVRASA